MAKALSLDGGLIAENIYDIAKRELNTSVRELKFIGGGSNGKAYKVMLADGNEIVIKAYRAEGMNESEAKQLRMLSANTHVKMPEVLFTYGDESIAVLGMSFIPGKNALNPLFLCKQAALRRSFAEEVVDGMLEWHGVTRSMFGSLEAPEYSSWHELYREKRAADILDGIKALADSGKFSEKKYDILCKATEVYDKVEEEPKNAVLIHGDLNIMNIMADPRTFKLTGFIDPFGSVWADREYDLFQLRNMWGDRFCLYDTYKQRCGGLSEYSDFRVAYYGTMNEVSCRLNGSMIFTLWEDLWFNRLNKELKKINK